MPNRAKPGAPNVLDIVPDGTGYGQFGCYGSPINAPNLDRLAENGLRYTNMHTTALCSPSRSWMLTGRYSWCWTWAGNTQFRRWKRETCRGGASHSFIAHWPAGITAKGENRHQYAHIIASEHRNCMWSPRPTFPKARTRCATSSNRPGRPISPRVRAHRGIHARR